MKHAVSILLLSVVPELAQPIAAQVNTQANGQPRFELADVHVSPTAYWFAQNTGGQIRPGFLREGVYIYRDATLLGLIQAAYGVTEDAVSGGPSWLKSDLFDVVAKVPDGAPPDSLKLMLQSLLADRFALVVQNESRPTPRYVLGLGKGAPKLKRSAANAETTCKQQAGAPTQGPDGRPEPPDVTATCTNMTSRQLADTIKQLAGGYTTYLDHDIVDSTNLDGRWDFELTFTPAGSSGVKGRDSVTIVDAVNKQLGLSLELRDVPVPATVVKTVNRTPTPNAPEVATKLAVAPPRFEVVSVKPLDPTQRIALPGPNGGSQYRAVGTIRSLTASAYQIQPNASFDKIVGIPKSADSRIWEITAKYPDSGEGAPLVNGGRTVPPTQSVLLRMVQSLMADQFGLKTHTENREIAVYVLNVDGKHKLTKADPSERSDCRPDPNAPKPFPGLGVMANCKNITMAEFARNLEQASGFFDHPILDETGLEGGWDFLLGFSPLRPQVAIPSPAAQGGASPAVAAAIPDAMSAPEAVQKQLGIKLVRAKRSVPVIVVDHVEEKPIQ